MLAYHAKWSLTMLRCPSHVAPLVEGGRLRMALCLQYSLPMDRSLLKVRACTLFLLLSPLPLCLPNLPLLPARTPL
jgi:hypothetical protein